MGEIGARRPNAARATDGNGARRRRAQAAKIPEGFSNASPKKNFRHPLVLTMQNETDSKFNWIEF
jgi:hypothetical protein